ncbi:AAA family ATPase [Blautia faecis]|uniref:AAA family ATPase n=1 Tax=Blautia faecis TaxID=871665 RepID=UPI0022E30C5B|nr:AAA family ATPase [Blautia faecis]
MAYTTKQAIETLDGYLSINESDKEYIEDTKERGFVFKLPTGERIVIFVYPLVHKQDNTKNYFDTRDSGAYERGVTWKFAQKEGLKYFCLGVNSQVDKFQDYIFSLECDEKIIEKISGTKDGYRNGPGNQIIIPNDYKPQLKFERIQNKLGIYIAAIHKDGLEQYLSYYDNRPYLGKQEIDENSVEANNVYQKSATDADTMLDVEIQDEDSEERNKRLFRYWMRLQVKPEWDSDAGNSYNEKTIDSYIRYIETTPLPMVEEHSVFYTTDIGQINIAMNELEKESENNGGQRRAVKKYIQYLIDSEDDYMKPIYNTDIDADYERNRIVFGAPGTGKSFELKNDCHKLMMDTAGTYERVTFHPDYSYSQFVGTYKPVMDMDEKSIRYDFVPGPFMRIYVDALKSGRTEAPQPHLLLIEEINRAKVAAVFGDVFQLLDRDDDGVSEYEIQASEDVRKYLASKLGGSPDNYRKIKIPNNMFIWATMNSADQGVFPMDTAFKRRWNFEYLGINENEEKIAAIGNIKLARTDEVINWNTLRKAINAKMSSDEFRINEDKLIGPFFLSKKIIMSDELGMIVNQDRFVKAFKSKVIMYLYEDAVKQKKHNFFDGCDSSKYSSVCDAFDEKGIGIFGDTFKELYYDRQRNDA